MNTPCFAGPTPLYFPTCMFQVKKQREILYTVSCACAMYGLHRCVCVCDIWIDEKCLPILAGGNLMFAADCLTKSAAFMTDMTLRRWSHVPAKSTTFFSTDGTWLTQEPPCRVFSILLSLPIEGIPVGLTQYELLSERSIQSFRTENWAWDGRTSSTLSSTLREQTPVATPLHFPQFKC